MNPLYLHPLPAQKLPGFALSVGTYFLVIAVLHFVAFYSLGDAVLSKLNAWAGTAIFVGFPTVLALLGVRSHSHGILQGAGWVSPQRNVNEIRTVRNTNQAPATMLDKNNK